MPTGILTVATKLDDNRGVQFKSHHKVLECMASILLDNDVCKGCMMYIIIKRLSICKISNCIGRHKGTSIGE